MSEFCDSQYQRKAGKRFKNRSIRQVITPKVKRFFPYALEVECCPVCGKYLDESYRNPPGKPSRSMCQRHYKAFVLNFVATYPLSPTCAVSAISLTDKP